MVMMEACSSVQKFAYDCDVMDSKCNRVWDS